MPRRATRTSGGGQQRDTHTVATVGQTAHEESEAQPVGSERGAERQTLSDQLACYAPEGDERPKAVLLRLDDRGAGQLFELEGGSLVLGRGWNADARLDDERVSRTHAELRWRDGNLNVSDRGSTGGTYVDGVKVQQKVLRDGCLLQLGAGVAFCVRLVSGRERDALFCLQDRALYDPLTGLHNRRYLAELLTAEVAYARRHATPLSVIVIDIDHFKQVNDTYGHLVGDRVLQQVAGIAAGQVRTEDVLTRYGGEEFVAVLRHTPVEGALVLAERIRACVEAESFAVGRVEQAPGVCVTISAGCASLDCTAPQSADRLIELADQRLYQAKQQGRNRVASGESNKLGAPPAPLASASDDGALASQESRVEEASSPPSRTRSEVVSKLARAFDELDPHEQVVVGLYYQEQCCLEEICAIVELPLRQVEVVLSQGVAKVWRSAAVAGAA